MLEWTKLLNDKRRKEDLAGEYEDSGTRGGRDEAERDYDRILFANPTRRLADKTQVFPLDPIDSVRSRLTHSYEVSNLCRSIGMKLAFEFESEVFGENHEKLEVKRKVPAMLAAIGLAHDLGNPPFGHQGEQAVRLWFNEKNSPSNKIHNDFLLFDGNPQTFRLLTKLQILNDNYGLNLTYGTLAALVKYPWFSDSPDDKRFHDKKFGIFKSEKEVIESVWDKTGLAEGQRHPFTYVMEACDDIAYCVLDAEDTVKKGYASFYDLMAYLKEQGGSNKIIDDVIKFSEEKNHDFSKQELTSSELNEISMQMFRVKAIYHLITEATKCFVEHIDHILKGEIDTTFELVEKCNASLLCKLLKDFDKRYGFKNANVYRLELKGNNYIQNTMSMLWEAIVESETPFSRYAITQISENYKRAKESSSMDESYKDCQLLADSISGMTDKYLILTHENLVELYNK